MSEPGTHEMATQAQPPGAAAAPDADADSTSDLTTMRLRVVLPDRLLVDEPVDKVVAEAQNGSFGLLPRHVDFIAGLVPGIVSFWPSDGHECFLAVDEGVLVKCGQTVSISARSAVRGDSLATLRDTVQSQFVELDERARSARSALARLEAGVVRRFIELRRET